jgi:hypothetical protein
MKNVLILVSGIFLIACASVKVEVSKATSQQWSGGAAQQKGYNYFIQFTASKDVVIDSVYIDAYCFKLTETRQASAQYFWFKENDVYTIMIRHVQFQGRRIPEQPIPEEIVCPAVKKKGIVLVVYHENGKRGKFEIQELEKVQGIAYP